MWQMVWFDAWRHALTGKSYVNPGNVSVAAEVVFHDSRPWELKWGHRLFLEALQQVGCNRWLTDKAFSVGNILILEIP